MDENKCKVYLLSGFLGSGKTTLLKHLLETHPENERVAVLMNEFGKAGVDGDVVRKNGLEIIEISRGSIFCACAKGDFLRGLYTILKDFRPTVLLVEASGVADTTDMKKDLGHGMLHDYYRFAGNICVIDAEHFEDWLDLFNAVIKQTEAATQLIINKTDLVTQEQADALEKHLHELNPSAQITRAAFGNVPWSLFRSDEADEKMAEIPEAEAWEKFIDDVLANATPHKFARRRLKITSLSVGTFGISAVSGKSPSSCAVFQPGTVRFVSAPLNENSSATVVMSFSSSSISSPWVAIRDFI